MGKVLIDADVLVYESAFAAQKTRYHYQRESFDSADDAKAFCADNELNYAQLRKDGEITTTVEVLPEGACKNILAQKLGGILQACGSDDYALMLSGDGNFREEFAVTKGYKENRKDTPKPQHFAYVRQLVLENPRTDMTTGVEADDAMGILATLDPKAIIATIDKDLNMIPCRHFDWNKGLRYSVSETDAIYWFCRQLLTGDSTDNIPGIPGVGEKKAETLLQDHRGNPAGLWAVVKEQYSKGPFKFKDGTQTNKDVQQYLAEQGILLWIQRRAEERWTPAYFEETYING